MNAVTPMLCNCVTWGRPEGERRRDAAFALLQDRRAGLIRRARRALLELLIERGTATIDEVRARVPLPEGINPKAFGPAASELVKAGIIAADGFARSVRAVAHARPVQVWRLLNRHAALAWLAAHPDPCDQREEAVMVAELQDWFQR